MIQSICVSKSFLCLQKLFLPPFNWVMSFEAWREWMCACFERRLLSWIDLFAIYISKTFSLRFWCERRTYHLLWSITKLHQFFFTLSTAFFLLNCFPCKNWKKAHLANFFFQLSRNSVFHWINPTTIYASKTLESLFIMQFNGL
jgi:hypothetical protein